MFFLSIDSAETKKWNDQINTHEKVYVDMHLTNIIIIYISIERSEQFYEDKDHIFAVLHRLRLGGLRLRLRLRLRVVSLGLRLKA
jgi:hypothetical protein